MYVVRCMMYVVLQFVKHVMCFKKQTTRSRSFFVFALKERIQSRPCPWLGRAPACAGCVLQGVDPAVVLRSSVRRRCARAERANHLRSLRVTGASKNRVVERSVLSLVRVLDVCARSHESLHRSQVPSKRSQVKGRVLLCVGRCKQDRFSP